MVGLPYPNKNDIELDAKMKVYSFSGILYQMATAMLEASYFKALLKMI